MCFQGWARYRCGHIKAFEQTCAHADELDVNFWIMVACPYYSNSSRPCDFMCSKHKYYCAESPDASYLDKIHCQRDKADEKVKELYEEIYNRWGQLLRKTSKEHYARGGTQAEYLASESVQKVQAHMEGLNDQRNAMRRELGNYNHMISEAMKFYQLYGSQAVMQPSTTAGMPPQASGSLAYGSLGSIEGVLGSPMKTGQSLYTAGPIMPNDNPFGDTASPAATATHQLQSRMFGPPSSSSPAPVTRRLGGLYNPSMAQMNSATQSIPPANAASGISEASNSPQKKHGRPRKKGVEDSPNKEAPGVRRSTRVRSKQVNYKEDVSDISRSSSPDKSDASAFTPSKSDVSASPIKKKTYQQVSSRMQNMQQGLLSRGSPSLLDKIGDWKRRDSSLGTPPVFRYTASQQHLQIPPTRTGSPLKNESVQTRAPDTPETIIMSKYQASQPSIQIRGLQAEAGGQRPSTMEDTGMQQQNWIVDKNGGSSIVSAALAIGGMLRSSTQQPTPMPLTSLSDYNRMRQSFHATTGRSHFAPLSQPQQQQPNTDPHVKRIASAPYGDSPSKRARRSFPSPNTRDPALLQAQIDSVATSPPEQNMLPSAPMLVPTPGNFGAEGEEGEPFPDIDWSLLNGESLN